MDIEEAEIKKLCVNGTCKAARLIEDGFLPIFLYYFQLVHVVI
jgi:hypothetical protein